MRLLNGVEVSRLGDCPFPADLGQVGLTESQLPWTNSVRRRGLKLPMKEKFQYQFAA